MTVFPQRFWKPSLTTQFKICPIPFHLDTYRGCIYGCRYCFARDFTTFNRKGKPFNFIECNHPEKLKNWFWRIQLKTTIDYEKGEEVAFKERIPLKIGACSDPFPPIEQKLGVTYNTLEYLQDYDYPVEIQTKNPEGLLPYAKDYSFEANLTVAVTLITLDHDFARIAEPFAPLPAERLKAIKQLTNLGINVMVKIQPAIYPKIMKELPFLVQAIKEAGCWAFNIEGLKYRISMSKCERKLFQEIGDALGLDMRAFFKKEIMTETDYEYGRYKKLEYITFAKELAQYHKIKFFVADNNLDLVKLGDGFECCGTEKLRNYKVFGNCKRAQILNLPIPNASSELGNVKINFCRGTQDENKTLNEACTLNKPLSLKEAF